MFEPLYDTHYSFTYLALVITILLVCKMLGDMKNNQAFCKIDHCHSRKKRDRNWNLNPTLTMHFFFLFTLFARIIHCVFQFDKYFRIALTCLISLILRRALWKVIERLTFSVNLECNKYTYFYVSTFLVRWHVTNICREMDRTG